MRDILEKKYTRIDIQGVKALALEDPARLVEKSEGYYNAQVLSAAKTIAQNEKYKFVLLCGPSASGKTTTAHKLRHCLSGLGKGGRVISMDNFFTGIDSYPLRENGTPDLESVYSMDLDLLNKCFDRLMAQGESMFPIYDFTEQMQKRNAHHVVLGEGDVLIMEGIHALNPMVLSRIPPERIFRLYVSVRTKFVEGEEEVLKPKDIRLMRRLVRDNNFRNYPPESTLRQWMYVLEGERENIDPYRDDVDLKMDNTLDYEVCVWHEQLESLLQTVDRDSFQAYPEMQRILDALTRFPQVCHDFIPRNSLLREFIGATEMDKKP